MQKFLCFDYTYITKYIVTIAILLLYATWKFKINIWLKIATESNNQMIKTALKWIYVDF